MGYVPHPPYRMPGARMAVALAQCTNCGAPSPGACCTWCGTTYDGWPAPPPDRLVPRPKHYDELPGGMAESEPRYCTTCMFYDTKSSYAHCMHTVRSVSVIDGYKFYQTASWERGQHGKCGPEGKNWEEKPKSWRKENCLHTFLILLFFTFVYLVLR